MARDNDDSPARSYSMGQVTIEGRLAGDIKNIGKGDDQPTIAATIFGNSTKYNGHEGSLRFGLIVNGPRAKAIWEQRDYYTKGANVMAGGELFSGEEYEDQAQIEIAGWGSWLNPNHKWAENGGGSSRKTSRRRDEDEDDNDRGSRSGRSSRRKDEDEDSGSRGGRSSSRRDRGGDDDKSGSDRSSRRRRVQENGDDD